MSLTTFLKRHALGRVLYRHHPVGLMPERLYAWLDALRDIRDVPGDIVEIGCSVGGTAALSWSFLDRTGDRRRYVCIDTFSGFIPEQFDVDVASGTDPAKRTMFDGNSLNLARWVLAHHGAEAVELVQGDIMRLDPARMPSSIAAALVDVDLAEPVRAALERVWPRLSPGGIVLVDDCPEDTDWQARRGYQEFCRTYEQPERYLFGMGVVTRPRAAGTKVDREG